MKSTYTYSPLDELWLDSPEPARNFENILFNNSYFTLIDQCGRGRGTHMTDDGYLNHVITNERILFVRDDETGSYFSVAWAPVFRQYSSYKCGAGINYQIYENTTDDLQVTWRIYVPAGNDPIEIWDVRIKNLAARPRQISLFTYSEINCDGTDTYCNFLFRSGMFDADVNSIVIRQDAEFYELHDFPYHNGFLTADRVPSSWDGDKSQFIGPRNSIANPVAVCSGKCSGSIASRETPTGSMQFKLSLKPGSFEDTRMLVGAFSDSAVLKSLRSRYLGGNLDHDADFDAMCDERAAMMQNIQVRTPELTVNRMLNKWVKQQMNYGATWCRWGYKGYRDIVQNSQNFVTQDSKLCRKNFCTALRYQYADGFALRGWHPLDTMRYVDSAQWLISAITEYVKETGDFAFVDERVSYMDSGEDTVYGHLLKAMERLHTDRGSHGLCLAFFGDWNDSLTAVCRKGRGESVWMAMAFCRSALLMKELAEQIGRVEDAKRMANWHGEVAQAINKYAWDGKWYICAFDDDGKPIGSDKNEQGKIFLNMQSWAQLGRVVSDERWNAALESIDKHLNTGWGYRLQWPTYIKPESNVGRLSYLQPGICENGSVYTHGNAFLMLALLERGLADKALDVWRQINPANTARPLSCQTNVFINGYWGPDHLVKPGFAELPWLTGSAGWMFMCIVEYVLGLRRTYDGIVLNPCMPSTWKNASIKRVFRGTTYDITINNVQGKQAAPVTHLAIDGIASDSHKPLPIDGQKHDVIVSI